MGKKKGGSQVRIELPVDEWSRRFEALQRAEPAGPLTMSLNEAVQQNLPAIEAALKRGLRLAEVAEVIGEGLDSRISEPTLRSYLGAARAARKKLETPPPAFAVAGHAADADASEVDDGSSELEEKADGVALIELCGLPESSHGDFVVGYLEEFLSEQPVADASDPSRRSVRPDNAA